LCSIVKNRSKDIGNLLLWSNLTQPERESVILVLR
jgi:hypothetical protein